MGVPEKAERNEEIWRRYGAGETQMELAEAFKLKQYRISEILSQKRRAAGYDKLSDWRDDLVRQALDDASALVGIREADLPIAFSTSGKPLMNPETGEYIKDITPKLAAIDRLAQHRRDLAKLLGLNAPDKSVVDSTLHYIVEGVDTDKMK